MRSIRNQSIQIIYEDIFRHCSMVLTFALVNFGPRFLETTLLPKQRLPNHQTNKNEELEIRIKAQNELIEYLGIICIIQHIRQPLLLARPT